MGTPRLPGRRGRAARVAAAVAALTLLVACNESDGGGDDGPTSTAPAAGSAAASVAAEGFAFTPSALTVAAGTTVTWTNKDGAEHTVSGDGLDGDLQPGGTYEKRFDEAGTFSYACRIHPSMTGTVTVS